MLKNTDDLDKVILMNHLSGLRYPIKKEGILKFVQSQNKPNVKRAVRVLSDLPDDTSYDSIAQILNQATKD